MSESPPILDPVCAGDDAAEAEGASGKNTVETGGVGGSWWSNFVTIAKDKTASTLEMVKKDLGEFTQTAGEAMSSTSSLVSQIKASAAHGEYPKPPRTFNLFQGLRSAVLEDDSQTQMIQVDEEDDIKVFDVFSSRLNDLQRQTGTFLDDPDTSSYSKFERWCGAFDVADMKAAISDLLADNKGMRTMYTKLVPANTDHCTFWQRYFYKVHCLEEDEKRRNALKNRADALQKETNTDWDGENEWEDLVGSPPPKPLASTGTHVETTLKADQGQGESGDHSASGAVLLVPSTEVKLTTSCGPADFEDAPATASGNTAGSLAESADLTLTPPAAQQLAHSIHSNEPVSPLAPTADNESVPPTMMSSANSNTLDSMTSSLVHVQLTDSPCQSPVPDSATSVGKADIGSDQSQPGSTSSSHSNSGEARGGSASSHEEDSSSRESVASEEWEKDFNLSAAEMKLASEMAKDMKNAAVTELDWENWE